MRFVGFIGPSYKLTSVNVDCQRSICLYPQKNEMPDAKEHEIGSLIGTPGLGLLATIGSGPILGSHVASDGQLFVASGSTLYKVSSSWVATSVATLSSSSNQVSMADNGKHLAVVNGTTSGFLITLASLASASIPFPGTIDFVPFQGADVVTYQDGYFIFNHTGTGQFFISGNLTSIVADDTTIDAADFSSAEGAPDNIISILSCHRDLWIFGKQSTEVFFNSGATFPFERTQGAFIEYGCAAAFSVAKMNNNVYWVGRDETGSGVVLQTAGYQPQRISTHAVEAAIQSYGDISTATSYTYQENGHSFYALNFPSANTTWVYDASTSLWHERVYTNEGQFERHRANNHAYAYSTHVVGDYQNGNIYQLSSAIYSDNGAEITRQRIAPHLSDGLTRIFHHSFQLDVESGVGLDGTTQGIDPQAMLQFSDDGGHSWSNEKWTSLGKIGQTKFRALWRRLGCSRDRVYKITITDPVKVVLIGAELGLEKGAS